MWRSVLRDSNTLTALEADLLRRASAFPDGKLVDYDFPPSPRSAGNDRSYERATWTRAGYYGPLLGELSDATQGKVGDCWFLSAASQVARQPDLARHLVAAEHPEAGFYVFSFYKEGNWILTYVDDFLPQLGGRPLFAFSSSAARPEKPAGPFFQLLEKAYAKLRGSYESLSMGSVAYAFTDLTGEPCSTEDVTPQVWEVVRPTLSKRWLITASPYYPQLATGQEIASTGLYANHAYSLSRVAQIGGDKLFELRNPWGHLEWKGPWSDGDARWGARETRSLGHTLADDGDFWMDLADFRKYFTKLIVCRLYETTASPPSRGLKVYENGLSWQSAKIRGRWQGTSAGGNQNYATWKRNPHYRILAPQAAPLFVSLSQEDVEWRERATRTTRQQYFSIGITVSDTSSVRAQTPSYVQARDTSLDFAAVAPTLFLTPATFLPGQESEFLLCVFCPVAFQIFPSGP